MIHAALGSAALNVGRSHICNCFLNTVSAWFLDSAALVAGCGIHPRRATRVRTDVGYGELPSRTRSNRLRPLHGSDRGLESVEVRARVDGYLDLINFKEGGRR